MSIIGHTSKIKVIAFIFNCGADPHDTGGLPQNEDRFFSNVRGQFPQDTERATVRI